MSKKRQRPDPLTAGPAEVSRPADLAVDPDLAEQLMLGNAAFQAQVTGGQELGLDEAVWMGAEAEVGDGGFARALTSAGRDVVAALLRTPREPDSFGRLVEIVARSALPDERREALLARLTRDQQAALEARAACDRWLGPLDDRGRSAWVAVVDRAVAASVGAAGEVGDVLAAACGREGGAELHPHAEDAVRGLVGDVLLRLRLEEDDEEVGATDYQGEAEGS